MRFWQICHGLCIVAHIGMAVAGLVVFILAGQQSVSSNRFIPSYGFPSNNYSVSRSQRSRIEFVVLPWATFGVAALSLSSNTIALVVISLFEFRRTSSQTQRRVSFLKGFVVLTYVGNFILGIADAVLLGFLASRVGTYDLLRAPLALTAISTVFAFATGGFYIAHYRSCDKFKHESSHIGWDQPSYTNQIGPGSQPQYGNYPQQGNYTNWSNQPSYGNQPDYGYAPNK